MMDNSDLDDNYPEVCPAKIGTSRQACEGEEESEARSTSTPTPSPSSSLFGWLVGFLTSSPTPRLYHHGPQDRASDNFTCCHTRDREGRP